MKELKVAICLRNEGKLKESNETLEKLIQATPDNPIINYHYAWSFNVLG